MRALYNENNPFAANWLRNLISAGHLAPGDVDERSIKELTIDDLKGYTQCHFFAGIGGWPYALRLAGWPDDKPAWTGSCPCQPFSEAGQQAGTADARHLWPAFYTLIEQARPPNVFGEQVASALGRDWLSGVRSDLERAGYAFGAANLCAAGVGAPHARQRHYWVADSGCVRRRELLQIDTAQESFSSAERKEGSFWLRSGGAPSRGRDERTRLCSPDVLLLADGVSPALDGYGNAIVPQVAAEFITAYREINGR